MAALLLPRGEPSSRSIKSSSNMLNTARRGQLRHQGRVLALPLFAFVKLAHSLVGPAGVGGADERRRLVARIFPKQCLH